MQKEDLTKISYSDLTNLMMDHILDIYIQLSEEKFVRIISGKSTDPRDILKKYVEKGVVFFFINNDFYASLKESLNQKFESNVSEFLSSDKNKRLHLAGEMVDQLRVLVKSLGVNEDVIKKTDSVVEDVMNLSKEIAPIEAMLELIKGKGRYIQEHGLLTSIVCCLLADRCSWANDEIKKTLILASLFQDISLDSDRLAKIYDTSHEPFLNITVESQKEVVVNHVSYSALMINGIGPNSDEVARLIRNHHEKPDGFGFLKRLNSKSTGPVDACFIISVRFSHELLENKPLSAASIKQIAQSLNELFNIGNFKQIYKTFLEIFSEIRAF